MCSDKINLFVFNIITHFFFAFNTFKPKHIFEIYGMAVYGFVKICYDIINDNNKNRYGSERK